MVKQIEGQISFDFMKTTDLKEIAMDDYMNKPEALDTIEKGPVKKTRASKISKNENKTEKHTAEAFSITETAYENQKSNTSKKGVIGALQNKSAEMTHSKKNDLKAAAGRKETHSQTKTNISPAPNPFSHCMEHYQQAFMYVNENRGITLGTIMRLYRLSANAASEIFQKLINNKVIDESGRLYKEKKEL